MLFLCPFYVLYQLPNSCFQFLVPLDLHTTSDLSVFVVAPLEYQLLVNLSKLFLTANVS